ncbi:hypothetical protein M514_00026 [Trichuris suis]|uniref:Uncharacterized protein n=1 Tax=Trichuris suis TaxID=68888 RepID=A0A085MNR7_9BILA|nr:hypothetical protein M513_00026 [Trichuris suis]KFD72884.1 hypothetical protein M514_00026 [Trichuris suis]
MNLKSSCEKCIKASVVIFEYNKGVLLNPLEDVEARNLWIPLYMLRTYLLNIQRAGPPLWSMDKEAYGDPFLSPSSNDASHDVSDHTSQTKEFQPEKGG